MTRVVFPDHLLPLTGGERESRFPGCEKTLARSAIAIDGQIHQDAYLEEIGPDSEVFFLQRLEGEVAVAGSRASEGRRGENDACGPKP